MHLDKHVIKMILETCQLLCSAIHISGSYVPCYKLTHKNHPCAIWVRESINNYKWLCELGIELCNEYTYRYGKTHKCQQYIIDLEKKPPELPMVNMTMPPIVTPDIYKKYDIITAYRYYYLFDKTDILSWKGKIAGRNTPEWVQVMTNYSK